MTYPDYPSTRPNQDPGDPMQVKCAYAFTLTRYTHPDQLPYFARRINWFYNNDCNVRFDEDDPNGLDIRWFYGYYLPYGGFLYESMGDMQGITEAQMREYTSPLAEWPQDLSQAFPSWPYPEPTEPEPTPEEPPAESTPDSETGT